MSALVRPLVEGDSLAAVSHIYAESWRTAYRGIVPQVYLDRLTDSAWIPALADQTRNSLVLEQEGRLVDRPPLVRRETPGSPAGAKSSPSTCYRRSGAGAWERHC